MRKINKFCFTYIWSHLISQGQKLSRSQLKQQPAEGKRLLAAKLLGFNSGQGWPGLLQLGWVSVGLHIKNGSPWLRCLEFCTTVTEEHLYEMLLLISLRRGFALRTSELRCTSHFNGWSCSECADKHRVHHERGVMFKTQVEFTNAISQPLIVKYQPEATQQPKPYQLHQILTPRHCKVCSYDGLPELITHRII